MIMEGIFVLKKCFFSFAFLLFIHLSIGTHSEAAQFKDVPDDADYKEALDWAIENDILKGYPDGTFRPYDTLTEAQFLKMYIR